MDITSDELSGVTVVRLNGALDSRSAPLVREHLSRLLAAGATRFVVDGGQLGFVDSTGLGTLIFLRRTARQRKGDLCIAAPGRDLIQVLDFSGMDQVFNVVPDVPAAVTKLTAPTS